MLKIWAYSWHNTHAKASQWVRETRGLFNKVEVTNISITASQEYRAYVYGQTEDESRPCHLPLL